MFLIAWTDPTPGVIDKRARSILDLACGQGKPMILIKLRRKINNAVGVELFEPYVQEAKEQKVHDKYLLQDIRKIKFPKKSFDVVLASQVLEHMPKKEAWKVLDNMESIAKMQVVISTPIGECYQPVVKGNKLEEHQSSFLPEDFEKRGYKTIRYGWRWLLDEHSQGLMYKVTHPLLRKLLYLFNLLVTPLYFLFQNSCDYSFVAYKNISE
ncbi:MAG TPA: class I SAM-dependent methyltransferase [Puia sp.]